MQTIASTSERSRLREAQPRRPAGVREARTPIAHTAALLGARSPTRGPLHHGLPGQPGQQRAAAGGGEFGLFPNLPSQTSCEHPVHEPAPEVIAAGLPGTQVIVIPKHQESQGAGCDPLACRPVTIVGTPTNAEERSRSESPTTSPRRSPTNHQSNAQSHPGCAVTDWFLDHGTDDR